MAIRVSPTRMELTRLKKRLKTAVRGHKLLKDKNDELVRTFISFIRRNKELREQVEASLAAAMGSAAIAKAKMGEESMTEALMYPVSEAHAQVSTKNIMSVIVPQISFRPDGKEADLPYGFAFTPSELDTAVLDVAALLPQLIELAGVEKTCDMLADEIEKTKRRVNALEHVSIPEMQEGIRAITMKLEENERANTTRLMKVKTMIADRN